MDAYDPAGYIEGVPVKISEKFKPPPRISLSASCNHSLNIELLTTEHDFKFEESCIKWIDGYNERKAKLKSEREARIAEYELAKEERINRLKEEAIKAKLKEEEEILKQEEDDNQPADNEEVNIPDTQPATEEEQELDSDNECEVGAALLSPNQFSMSAAETFLKQPEASNVTVPKDQPFMQPGVQYNVGAGTAFVPMHQSAHGNIQAAAAAQSNLLIPTQVQPPALCNSIQSNRQTANINIAEFETSASDPFDTAALNSINDMEELAKVLGAANMSQPAASSQPYHNPTYGLNGAVPYAQTPNPYYKSDSQTQYNPMYTQLPHSTAAFAGQESLRGGIYHPRYSTVSQPAPSDQYKNKFHNVHTPTTMQYTSSHSSNSHLTTNNYMYSASGLVSSAAPFKRPDLEDFYSKYYSNKKPEVNGSRSGESTPTNSLGNTLRSSASVPDLTVDDQEVSSINNSGGSHSPPPGGARPNSTGVHSFQNSFEQMNKSVSSQQPRLHDPFLDLNPDAQELVQNVSEMGFPRPRVARAVQKLGTDHKKLIEVLLALQNFQDDGESEYTAEVAFYYYMGDLEKVKQILPTSKQLVSLGFGEEKVVDMLLKADNDCSKAYEQLVA